MNIQEIRQQYPQYSDLSDEQLAKGLHAKFYADLPYADFAQKIGLAAEKPVKPDPSTLSQAAAGAAGYNSAMLAGIPGLVADTGLNVADLARAAYGYIGGKTGLVKPEDLPQPLDRSKYVGSSEWIKNRIRDAGGGVFIDNPNPEDPTSKFLNIVGSNVAGARSPGQVAGQSAAGISQAVADAAGFDTAGQILASMAPQGAGALSRKGVKSSLVGGGEEGRKRFAQNVQDLKNAGVDNPSVGLAGPRQAAALEALASRYPGSAGLMAQNTRDTQAALGARVRGISDQVTANRGDAATGTAMQQDILNRWKPEFDALYERLDKRVTDKVGDQRVPIENTLNAAGRVNAGIPGAPEVSRMFLKGSGLPALEDALLADSNIPAAQLQALLAKQQAERAALQAAYEQAATLNTDVLKAQDFHPVPGMPRVPGRLSPYPTEAQPGAPSALGALNDATGTVNATRVALESTNPTLPYPALRGVGSMIGAEAGDKLLHGNAESARYKQVYGGVAQDKRAAAEAAGAGPELARANRFYSQGVDKMEGILQPFTKDGVTPEQAYNQFRSTILSSPGKAYELRKSLSPEIRKMQTASLIDELGQATPGKQDAAGSLFSSETFLTNWNKLSPNSKAVMFSGFPEANKVRTDLEKVAKAAEMIRTKGGIYANPSGTAGAAAQIGVGSALTVGAVTGNVSLLASTLASVAGANITARMMTNPKFVNWLASADGIIKPESAQAHVRRLAVIANQSNDPELKAFAQSLSQQ